MKLDHIDHGKSFEWGLTSEDYARYRDIYPQSLYGKLTYLGIGLPGQQILDLGTGTGVFPRAMYTTGASFTGVDISKHQIEQARQLAEAQQMKIDWKVNPAEDIQFPDNTFDIVSAVQCWHYFNKKILLPKLLNLMKPKGKIAVIHMFWLPDECEISNATEKLILTHNPSWTGAGAQRMRMRIAPWSEANFHLDTLHTYDEMISFTRESWLGRIRASRGIAASLSEEKVKAFDEEHRELLERTVPYSFHILHQLTIEIYQRS